MNKHYAEHAMVAAAGFLLGAVFAMLVATGDTLLLVATGIVFGFAAWALFDQHFGGDWPWPLGRLKTLAAESSIGSPIPANKHNRLTFTKPQSQGDAMQDSNGSKFPLGTMVHVRRGVTDLDYPEMPFGGWVGRVIEVQKDACTTCLVRWSPETVAAASPIFKHRRDFTETWLDEDDLENDDGTLLPVEQPTATPFSGDEREDRIRSVFGLLNGEHLPSVCLDALLTYYEHLTVRLSFPFVGDFQRPTEPWRRPRSMSVVRLLQKAGVNDWDCILCRAVDDQGAWGMPLAEVRVAPRSANSQLLTDYCYWLRKYRGDLRPQ